MTLVAANPELKSPATGSSNIASPWVLIVGASSGIGRAVAKRWASAGSDVLLAGRDVEDLDRSAADLRLRYGRRAEVVSFDALDFASHEAFWRDCLDRAGGDLAGVVMLHGWMPPQADAQSDFALARKAIDTNYTSAVSLLTLAANDFEKKKRGFLCVFSSVAGDRGRQSNYAYGSAKAALSAFLQGLRNRLFKSGVTVLTVKPGFVDTAMTWGLPGLFLVATPEKVADDAFKAVGKGRAEIYTPFFWRYIMLIIKSVPEFVFKRMKL
jgi:decaprenylphospho-beta-D-erythro-pentofuranosid-2-ulose 2-reductase